MEPANHDRLYTIGETVDSLQASFPDVSHSSLRFLEREQLIHPRRTTGGHRLYTPEDLSRIRLIKRWQAARLSLAEIRTRLDQVGTDGRTGEMAEQFLGFAIAGEVGRARQSVLDSDEVGMPLSRIFDQVLRPALVEIGERWAAGTLTVAQEHELSELVRDIVAQLTLRHLPGETGFPVVVAACVAGELHDLGLRMVCGMLRERGAQVHFLGADVLPGFVVESVQRLAPSVLLLSISLVEHMPALDATLAALEAAPLASPGPIVMIGGNAVAGQSRVPGHGDVRVLGASSAEDVADLVLGAAGAA